MRIKWLYGLHPNLSVAIRSAETVSYSPDSIIEFIQSLSDHYRWFVSYTDRGVALVGERKTGGQYVVWLASISDKE